MIKDVEELTHTLVDVGIYLLDNKLGEAEATCGRLNVKVVVELKSKEEKE